MKKIECLACVMGVSIAAMMVYVLMNKETSKKANQVINDMLEETDKMIKGK